jgi:ribosomal silencing factor RsfS
MNEKKVGVSLSAVVQMLKRKLKKEGQILRKVRGENTDLGPYYILDIAKNFIVDSRMKPYQVIQLARAHLVLLGWEFCPEVVESAAGRKQKCLLRLDKIKKDFWVILDLGTVS